MSATSDRRGFLRGLVSLPLVGGGVTLLGNPTAAAVPVSKDLLDTYDTWLDLERSFLKWERFGPEGMEHLDRTGVEVVYRNRHTGELFDFRHQYGPGGRFHRVDGPQPSTRAALVLSAVGCPLPSR